MTMFDLKNGYNAVCISEGTRYGFRHIATLLHNGYEIHKDKVCYYNRTWERYTFQSVLQALIESAEKRKIINGKQAIEMNETINNF